MEQEILIDKQRTIYSAVELPTELEKSSVVGKFNLENRRYIGSKNKLLDWISALAYEHTKGESFCDIFAGTGVVAKKMLPRYKKLILNDFLFSNEVIFNAFFGMEKFDTDNLLECREELQNIRERAVDDEYFSKGYGGRYFSKRDAEIIGEIRARIEQNKSLNKRERDILIASLIYSADKIANTVGHYEAYRKKIDIEDRFIFNLIAPLDTTGKEIEIYREDANKLARKIEADVVFIDPPYNSRQYSRFYHVLEVLTKWKKPELVGMAMKPPAENMSDYSRSSAPKAFDDLVKNLQAKYLVVTYNNTYASKSSSSRNKITHEEILSSLNSVGRTKVFEKPFQFFNAGKTDLKDHREFVFITEVKL